MTILRSTVAAAAMAVCMAALGPGARASTNGGRVLRYDGAGQGPDYSTDIAVRADGDAFFVTGSSYGGPVNGDDITTIAYGRTGNRLWVASFNGVDSSIDQANAVAVPPHGGRVFVTGSSWGGSDTQTDIMTIAYRGANGDLLWAKPYDGPGHQTDAGSDLVASPSGRTVFVTGASAAADGTLDVVTIAYDAAGGAPRWIARSEGVTGGYDEGMAIDLSPGGSMVFVAGYRTGTSGIDLLILAYDAHSGDELWAHTIDAGGEEVGRSIAVAPDGTAVFVTGATTGGPADSRTPTDCASLGRSIGADYVTAAYAPVTGDRVWLKNYDGPDHDCDEAYGLAVSPDSSAVFVTGSSFSPATDSDAATIAYQADDGATRWAARYDGPDHHFDKGDSVTVDPGGGQVFVGGLATSAVTDYDFLTLFYDAASGAQLRVERYDGPGHAFDAPNAIAANPQGGAVVVTGGSTGANLAAGPDYATVIYRT